MSGYDVDQARRDRNRQLQQRVDSLERQLAQHLRLIGLLVRVAAGPDAEPLQVLDVCEAMDDASFDVAAGLDDLRVRDAVNALHTMDGAQLLQLLGGPA